MKAQHRMSNSQLGGQFSKPISQNPFNVFCAGKTSPKINTLAIVFFLHQSLQVFEPLLNLSTKTAFGFRPHFPLQTST